jgi:ABC-2 type transport system ATP-binding protein
MRAPAVLVEGLRVDYGATRALDDVSVVVEPGSTLGVLGHNGAGKTTLIRVLTTLVRPSAGRVVVDGVDAAADPHAVRRRIGVTGQYAGLDEYLTPIENLELFGRLVGLGRQSGAKAAELVDRFELGAVASKRTGELSGGTRRRVDLAASLVGAPSVLFLDEPTTGLDPSARAALWDVVGELTANGTTVLLTTQYLEEADRLADEIVVLRSGRIEAHGTPAQLKARVGGKVVHAVVPIDIATHVSIESATLEAVADGRVRISVPVADAVQAAAIAARLADVADTTLDDLEITSPSLDDVFFHLANQEVAA